VVPPTHLLPVKGLRALSRRQGPHEGNHSRAHSAAFYVEREREFRVLFSTRAAQIEFFHSTLFWTPFSGERPAYLWTPGHKGVAPNAVADATAKTYLAADHDRLIARDLAKHEHRRPCVYVQADTGDLRDMGIYLGSITEKLFLTACRAARLSNPLKPPHLWHFRTAGVAL